MSRYHALPIFAVAASALAADSAEHAAQMAKGLDVFTGSVAKVLTEQCVKCHGGEKGSKGGLDLATREALMKGGEEGAAIVPGKAAESYLMKLVRHEDDPHMPKKADKLSDADIAKLAEWIDLGAPYAKPLIDGKVTRDRSKVTDEDRKWWSFQPLADVQPPEVRSQKLKVKNPIDQFIFAKLEEKGVAPNMAAEKRKLIRRAYLDLIGLPPTPEQVEKFLADAAPNAWEKVIDELLASPHYGERWGRHWLDLARYAESHGYEQDYDRPNAFHYRDFVIKALNDDLPYDRFVQWQIAGDELAPENVEAWKATGFLAAGTHATQITANQAEKERYDELDDMAATIGTSILGLTVGCARCHDHKFDPIPTRDYYRLISTFTKTVRSDYPIELDPEKTKAARESFDRGHRGLTDARVAYEKGQLPAKFAAWLQTRPQIVPPRWVALEFASATAESQSAFTRQDDGSYVVAGPNQPGDTFTFVANTALKNITAIRLEALADSSLVKRGPGRADNGNFALSDFSVKAEAADGKTEPVTLKLVNPKADFEQGGLPIAATIDADKHSGWAIDPQFGKDHAAVYEIEAPVGFDGGTKLTFTLEFRTNDKHSIGRPRLSISTQPLPAPLDGGMIPQKLLENALSEGEGAPAALLEYYKRVVDPEWQRLNAAVSEHERLEPKPQLTPVLVSSEGLPAVRLHTQGPDFYEQTFMLRRGDLKQKEEEAKPGFLQVLTRAPEQQWITPPPPGARTPWQRASLAKWLTDSNAGAGQLAARVIVNRMWQHHFGRGLVATPSDFGAQGEKPTHPELLDWLAGELIRNGWRLKPLHKLMMTSATYAETSDFGNPQSADPNNTLFWRHNRQRLEGEAIRDSILAVTGALDRTMFGAGTLDPAMKRRSIYFQIKRSQLPPMMSTFDAPDTLGSLGLRSSTTVAPQALLLMNNTQIREAARGWARALISQPADAAVRHAYLEAFSRPAAEDEVATAIEFLKSQTESYLAAGKTSATELALTDYCQSLLGLNEFSYAD